MRTGLLTGCIALLAASFAMSAAGQFAPGTETLDAVIRKVDEEHRMITVQFENTDATETFPVADDAEFFSYDGIIDVPKSLSDLYFGQHVTLEFGGIEGEPTVAKVTGRDEADGD